MATELTLNRPIQPSHFIPSIPKITKMITSQRALISATHSRVKTCGLGDYSSVFRSFSTIKASSSEGISSDGSVSNFEGVESGDEKSVSQIKASLYQAIQGINRAIFGATSEKKSEIEGLVKQLESFNPTPDPTQNLEKVGGCWKLIYSTISILGSKRTKLGLRDFISLGEFLQIINVAEGKAVNVIKFNARGLKMLNGQLTIEASFKIASKSRVDIKYENSTITPDQVKMPPMEDKSVKKEEEFDEENDGKSLGSLLIDKKKKLVNGISKTRLNNKDCEVKKKEPKDEEYSNQDEKPSIKKTTNKKVEMKKKNVMKIKEEIGKKKKTVATEENGKKKEKKVFDLPGQKRDPPEERDPLRIFYESLYEQIPGSEMAAFWMMECGLLPMDMAKKVYEKKQKKNQLQKLSSPVKSATVSSSSVTKSVSVTTVKKRSASTTSTTTTFSTIKKPVSESKTVSNQSNKKRKVDGDRSSDDDDDDDFVPLSKTRTTKRPRL